MQVRYIDVYRIHGANTLPDGDPVPLISIDNPALNAILTTDPEAYVEHIDRAAAISLGLLTGLFKADGDETPEERLAVQIETIRTQRAARMSAGVYAILKERPTLQHHKSRRGGT